MPSSPNVLSPKEVISTSSSPSGSHRSAHRDRSKSPASQLENCAAIGLIKMGGEPKITHIKTTYPTTSNLTIATNHYSLPKDKETSRPIESGKIYKNDVATAIKMSASSSTNFASNTYRRGANKLHSSSMKVKGTQHNDTGIDLKHAANECRRNSHKAFDAQKLQSKMDVEKPLMPVCATLMPVCTTFKNCSNPKEHFLPNDTSLDDDYLSECENCKSAHGSRYYLDEEHEEQPQETMTLQRKMDEKETDEQTMYYRTSSTLPTNTKQKTT